MSQIERCFESTVEASREEVFRLLADARNLNRVTPSWFRFEILSSNSGAMRVGHEIDYRLHWRSLRFRWRSRVIEWQPPGLFTYEQARGPFRRFVHEHHFFESGQRTHIVDRVLYRPPGGALADRLVVGADLARIFAFREESVANLLGPQQLESVRPVYVAD
jgi:ligand-binding SRPBCC domain-containing protein